MSDSIYQKHVHNEEGWVCEKVSLDTGKGKEEMQQCREPNAPENAMGTKVYLNGEACAMKIFPRTE